MDDCQPSDFNLGGLRLRVRAFVRVTARGMIGVRVSMALRCS